MFEVDNLIEKIPGLLNEVSSTLNIALKKFSCSLGALIEKSPVTQGLLDRCIIFIYLGTPSEQVALDYVRKIPPSNKVLVITKTNVDIPNPPENFTTKYSGMR